MKKQNHHTEPWINPYQLLQKMENENIEYGYRDFTKKENINSKHEKFNDLEYIENNCYVLNPKEVWRFKIATCFDCSMMEWYWCKRIPFTDPHIFFIKYKKDKENEVVTHTVLYYHDTKYDKWYLMEYFWGMNKGIYGPYNTKLQLLYNYIKTYIHLTNEQLIMYLNDNVDVKSLYQQKELKFSQFVNKCYDGAVNNLVDFYKKIKI